MLCYITLYIILYTVPVDGNLTVCWLVPTKNGGRYTALWSDSIHYCHYLLPGAPAALRLLQVAVDVIPRGVCVCVCVCHLSLNGS